jgi:hypothetical protein
MEPTLPDQPGDMLDALERLVDKHGLGGVLWVLVEVCEQKAEHIRTNWQDKATARRWARAAAAIDQIINKGDLP